jgi:hypothetical protein
LGLFGFYLRPGVTLPLNHSDTTNQLASAMS